MSKSDFIRTAAVSPALKVANTSYNTDRIIACAREAADNGAAVILFPELAIPSYTCGDLFFQQHLYEGNLKGLSRIIEASASLDAVIIAGFYLRITNRLFDCAAVIRRGKLLGVIPKKERNHLKAGGLLPASGSLPKSAPSVSSVKIFPSGVFSFPMTITASPSAWKSAENRRSRYLLALSCVSAALRSSFIPAPALKPPEQQTPAEISRFTAAKSIRPVMSPPPAASGNPLQTRSTAATA